MLTLRLWWMNYIAKKNAQPTNPAGRIYRLRPFFSRIVFQYALIIRAHSFFFSFFWTSSSFLGLNLMWLNKFAYCRTFPDCFSLSSFVTFHNIDYIICRCAFFVILCPCFLHRNHLYDIPSQCYSSSNDHDYYMERWDWQASFFSFLLLNCSYTDFFFYDFSRRSESHLLFPSQS